MEKSRRDIIKEKIKNTYTNGEILDICIGFFIALEESNGEELLDDFLESVKSHKKHKK